MYRVINVSENVVKMKNISAHNNKLLVIVVGNFKIE